MPFEELLIRLDAWGSSVPRASLARASVASCPPDASLQNKKSRSYDEALLKQVEVVQSSPQQESVAELPETSWASLRRRCRVFMDSNAANVFFSAMCLGAAAAGSWLQLFRPPLEDPLKQPLPRRTVGDAGVGARHLRAASTLQRALARIGVGCVGLATKAVELDSSG